MKIPVDKEPYCILDISDNHIDYFQFTFDGTSEPVLLIFQPGACGLPLWRAIISADFLRL